MATNEEIAPSVQPLSTRHCKIDSIQRFIYLTDDAEVDKKSYRILFSKLRQIAKQLISLTDIGLLGSFIQQQQNVTERWVIILSTQSVLKTVPRIHDVTNISAIYVISFAQRCDMEIPTRYKKVS